MMKMHWKFLIPVGVILVNGAVTWPQTTPALGREVVETHGQASGDVTSSSAIIWTRVNEAALVSVEAALDPAFSDSQATEPVVVDAASDFTVKIDLTGLEPGQRYYYRLKLQPPDDPSRAFEGETGTFVTAPAPDQSSSFSFAWSGDSWAAFQPFDIFGAIEEQRPDFFLYLGDTVYTDLMVPPAKTLGQYRRAYKVNRSDEALRSFLVTTSVYAIWDDHEVQNNFDSRHRRIPIGRQAFLEYWPIRPNVEDPSRLYRSFRWGQAAELFILDTRQFRSPSSLPDTSEKTMLGAEQKAWFKAALLGSTARFKFVATTVPLRFHGRDSWEGYTTERQELFDFIGRNHIRNIIFLAADVHYAAVINHPEGFKEVFVGPLGQIPSRWQPARGQPETEFTSDREMTYGLVQVHGNQEPVSVNLMIFDENNSLLHTTTVVEAQ